MIEPAYSALAASLAEALVASGFLQAPAELMVDPASVFTPLGDEETLVLAASLVKLQTNPVRTLLGRAGPRYVVDRQCRLELAVAGPDRLMDGDRLADALAAIAAIPLRYPTLSGAAERVWLGERTDDELPPNGEAVTITFIIRVRSSDPLGLTP
ncbi:hypothetical protein [Brevundimonas sp.]|uniref:hypothetical protein n=1 Tax=Brevundimonas sp. TaxID=1871086 RepID=UPI00289FD647|nr:hypothetical protein [Brevundimonas sp.]